MPALMKCPRKGCNHPGPMGFTDPVPWGIHFYHGSHCPGAWLYREKWYDTEAAAWKQYKRDNPQLDPDWVKAFDARILKGSERAYTYWINRWNKRALGAR